MSFKLRGLIAIVFCFGVMIVFQKTSLAQVIEDQNTDKIILAYYPPLMIEAGLDQPGISIEIIAEAAKRLGRDIQLQFLPFQRAMKTLQHSTHAIQPALFRIPSREQNFQWIIKTHTLDHVFLTLDKPINTLEEARKLDVIGVETGGAVDVMLTKLGFKNLERVDRPEINVNKLKSGRIDAWALSKTLAEWTWKRAGQTDPLVVGQSIKKDDVYIAAGKGYPLEKLKLYQITLAKMHEDGTINKILESYR